MGVSSLQAIIIAVWVGLVMSRSLFGAATLSLRFSPMMTGLIVGIVFGDVPSALKITAAIQLIYMGVFAPGGQMPTEPCIAAAIAVPVALLSNLEPEAAIAIAVPVGLLGGYLYQFRIFLNSFLNRYTDRGVERVSESEITRGAIIFPITVSMLLFVPFMFITLKFGAPVIANFVQANSSTMIFHILSVIGGGLVAIGIATTVYVIGKKTYLPFFLAGYFLAVVTKDVGLTMLTFAIIGTIMAAVCLIIKNEAISESEGDA